MTNDQILQIAARHSAYADCTPTLRGDAILAFAREIEMARSTKKPSLIQRFRAWRNRTGFFMDGLNGGM